MLKSSTTCFVGTAIILACALDARAQTPAPPVAPAPVPEAMPYDIPYGTPIDLDTAQKAITAALAEAKKHNWKVAISVVAATSGLAALVVRSNVVRELAHPFYQALGYTRSKTQHVYTKAVAGQLATDECE